MKPEDCLVIARSDAGRSLTDSEWKALREWIQHKAIEATDAVTFLDMQAQDGWSICKHNTLLSPEATYEDCIRCEIEEK